VHEHPNLRVAGEPLADDDLAALVVTPSLGRALERELPDRVAELNGEILERREEVRVAVARDRLRRRRERDGLQARQDLGLGDVLSRDSTGPIRSLCVSDQEGVGWRGGSVRG
jgi:hypothetical protein